MKTSCKHVTEMKKYTSVYLGNQTGLHRIKFIETERKGEAFLGSSSI